MSNILPFPGGCRFDEATVKQVAQEIIDACGPSAGLRIGQLARSTSLNDVERSRLMAIAEG